jgi:ribonuclease HI
VYFDANALKVYVDGSANPNPGRGGIAGIVEYPDDLGGHSETAFQIGYVLTTNNRMEIRAVLHGLKFIAERQSSRVNFSRSAILTDSTYVFNGFRSAPYWAADRWQSAEGRPIENRDLWKQLLTAHANVRGRCDVRWIKGKSAPIVRAVDRLAKEAARGPLHIDHGYSGGTFARRMSTERRRAAEPFHAAGQSGFIRVYRIVTKRVAAGRREHKVSFEVFEAQRSAYGAAFYAYLDDDRGLHRNHCYRARFNRSPTYPKIVALEVVDCPTV